MYMHQYALQKKVYHSTFSGMSCSPSQRKINTGDQGTVAQSIDTLVMY